MKLLGAGLLWTSLICAGAIYSINLKNHINTIRKTLIMLEEMKMLLQYLNIPVYEMLVQISRKDYLRDLCYISECCCFMSRGEDFPLAWQNALKSSGHLYKTDEKDKLLQLGTNLGTSDTQNQIRILDMQTKYFEAYLNAAVEKSKKYSSMTLTLSVLCGCMIFILII